MQFAAADTTTKKTIQTAGTNGTRLDAISLSTNDTADVNLAFYVTISSVDYYLGVVHVPTGSGYAGVPRVEAMAVLAPVLGYLALPASAILKAACVATMTAAKVMDVVALGGDY
jgi:hypothetical protein